jgi:hypothetical protein
MFSGATISVSAKLERTRVEVGDSFRGSSRRRSNRSVIAAREG